MSRKKNEIIKSTFPKYYYLTKTFENDPRHYTMCAKVERINNKNLLYKANTDEGIPVIIPLDGHYMKLTVGWAICYEDTYNEEYGYRLAKNRLKNRPISVMYSDYNGEFKEDIVIAIMDAKCNYIHDNLSHFIPKDVETTTVKGNIATSDDISRYISALINEHVKAELRIDEIERKVDKKDVNDDVNIKRTNKKSDLDILKEFLEQLTSASER